MGQLKKSQLKGRSVTYRFLQKGRKNPVWKVQAIRANFQLTTRHRMRTYFQHNVDHYRESTEREAEWEFILDTNGRIVYEKAFNCKGKMLWGLIYSPPLTGGAIHAHYVGEDGYPCSQLNTDAEFVEISYSTEGYEIAIRYFDRKHQPQARFDGVHLLVDEIDEEGFSLETTYFDADNQPTLSEDGSCRLLNERDHWGNITGGAYFGVSGEPIVGNDGYIHKWVCQYDVHGNVIEVAYFGLEGEPILSENGAYNWTTEYDVQGNIIGAAYFGLEGEPVYRNKAYIELI